MTWCDVTALELQAGAGALNGRSRFEARKGSHAIQLHLELALERAIARWMRLDIAELGLELAVLH